MSKEASQATIQQLFDSALVGFFAEAKPAQAKKVCHIKTQTGGDKATFYFIEKSTAEDAVDLVIPSMYKDGSKTNAGSTRKVEVPISRIYYQDTVEDAEMKKTNIDLKSAFVVSMGNGLLRKEDMKVIDAIKAADSFSPSPGDSTAQKPVKIDLTDTGSIATTNNIKYLFANIRKATALASMTTSPERYKGVMVFMNSNNWAEMSTSDFLLNSDYSNAIKDGDKERPTTILGAELVIMEDLEDTEIYIVPSGTLCWFEWENSMVANAEFQPFAGLVWFLQAVKSVGCKVCDGARITVLTVAAPAFNQPTL